MTPETPDKRDELILRHLDGDTSPEEGKRVTKLLAEDETFRIRFFTFVNQTAKLREIMEPDMNAAAAAAPTASNQPAPARRRGPQADVPDQQSSLDLGRLYLNAVVGGAGGLLGWIAITLAAVSGPTYLVAALNGGLIGVCIGLAIGSTAGLVAAQSLRRTLRGAAYGAGLGALGGTIGIVLGEFIFVTLGGGVWARAVGWAIFGSLVGTSDGFAEKMPSKVRYGLLGGLLGGLIGGSTNEALMSLLAGNTARAWGSAIGLVMLGACIGALIGLVEVLLRPAWFFFLTGRLEGQTRSLDARRAITIGSADSCAIVIPSDPSVAPVHAEVVFAGGQFTIRPRDGKVNVRRETQEAEVTAHVLQARDRVQLGQTRMIFRTEEAKKS